MTNEQLQSFAANVAPENKMSEDRAELAVLWAVFHKASDKVKAEVLKELKLDAQSFQRASQPGHELWYPHYLQVAAKAARMIEPKPAKNI